MTFSGTKDHVISTGIPVHGYGPHVCVNIRLPLMAMWGGGLCGINDYVGSVGTCYAATLGMTSNLHVPTYSMDDHSSGPMDCRWVWKEEGLTDWRSGRGLLVQY